VFTAPVDERRNVMAGGAIAPISAYPLDAAKVFPNIHVTASNAQHVEGCGVMASLDAEATWQLVFELPPADPSGTLKLVLASIADVAATQSAYLRVLWIARANGESMDLAEASLNDEHSGGDLEIEHTTAEDDDFIITKVTLDADTITYGTDHFLLVNVVLKNTSWDLAVVWTFLPYLIWE
jgi:hypothetical protein